MWVLSDSVTIRPLCITSAPPSAPLSSPLSKHAAGLHNGPQTSVLHCSVLIGYSSDLFMGFVNNYKGFYQTFNHIIPLDS